MARSRCPLWYYNKCMSTKADTRAQQNNCLLPRLRELRKARNLTQKQVGDVLGITDQSYSRYETGEREPSLESLLKLSDLFGVTVDYLLGQKAVESSALTDYEIQLVELTRRVDDRARDDILALLRHHLPEGSGPDTITD